MKNLLLIGAGAVVEHNYRYPLQHLERMGVIRVLGVIDPNEGRARAISKFFKSAKPYTDCETCLGDGNYDLAVIASPPGMHASHACAALSFGCHVLCEKPLATSLYDIRRMNEAARRADRILGVAFPRRFHAGFSDVAKLIAGGGLGENMRFVYREGSAFQWNIASDAVFRREVSGGGVLIDKGVHMLDQLYWLFGGPIEVETAFDDSHFGGVETNAALRLGFPLARGSLQVSWEYALNNGLHIWGSHGEVTLNGEDMLGYRSRTSNGWVRVPAKSDWPADLEEKARKRICPSEGIDCFEAELVAMLRSILYGEPFPVTGNDAEAVLEAITKAYERMEPLDKPWLSEAEESEAHSKHWNRGGLR